MDRDYFPGCPFRHDPGTITFATVFDGVRVRGVIPCLYVNHLVDGGRVDSSFCSIYGRGPMSHPRSSTGCQTGRDYRHEIRRYEVGRRVLCVRHDNTEQ